MVSDDCRVVMGDWWLLVAIGNRVRYHGDGEETERTIVQMPTNGGLLISSSDSALCHRLQQHNTTCPIWAHCQSRRLDPSAAKLCTFLILPCGMLGARQLAVAPCEDWPCVIELGREEIVHVVMRQRAFRGELETDGLRLRYHQGVITTRMFVH